MICEACGGGGVLRNAVIDGQTIPGKEIIMRCDACQKFRDDFEAARSISPLVWCATLTDGTNAAVIDKEEDE